MDVETLAKNFFNEASTVSPVAHVALGHTLKPAGSEKLKLQQMVEKLKKFWLSIPQENQTVMMQQLVTLILEVASPVRVEFMLTTMEHLVEENVLIARMVCECLIDSPLLSVNRPAVWCSAFQFIRRVIGGVYYKGTRDLLHSILSKVLQANCSMNVAVGDCVKAVDDVVKYIINRQTCLLPSYFALNEVVKMQGDDTLAGHHNVFWTYLGQTLAKFVQSFNPTAQLVTVIGRSHLLPVVGYTTSHVWKLNPVTLRLHVSGPLPYGKELYEPQRFLLRYVLEQTYSRETICGILNLNKQVKQRCSVLESELVHLIINTLKDSENGIDQALQLRWQHLSSQVIFFVLFQFVSFPHMVQSLHQKLMDMKVQAGRDLLMWVLLQFISGSIQKNSLEDFLPVIGLYDLLYPDQVPLPLPNIADPSAVHQLAPTCIWIHLHRKASTSSTGVSVKQQLHRPIPQALANHVNFLQQAQNSRVNSITDFKIALLCNAYSTHSVSFQMPMSFLIDAIYGNGQQTTELPGGVLANAPTVPLSMEVLDRLTVHAKMSLIHSIGTRVIKLASSGGGYALAPALLETYSRLLVYVEIESLGIKGFINQLLPSVVRSSAFGILHSLLEMFSYRLCHVQPHYRLQLLSTLQGFQPTSNPQLHLCIENTMLRLIAGLGLWELQPQLARHFGPEHTRPQIISQDSEELNRVLVLRLAQAMHVTGPDCIPAAWCSDLLQLVQHSTPHTWSQYTIDCFPLVFKDFYRKVSCPKEDKAALKRNVESEHRKWKSMMGEADLITYFSGSMSQPLFLCILWKSLMEDNRISPTAFKVLEKIGPRGLTAHVRMLVDYLTYEVSALKNEQPMKKVQALNDLVWQCNIIPIDRLILILVLRVTDNSEAQAAMFIIQVLLLKMSNFLTRVRDFVHSNSPDTWAQDDWHNRHTMFHFQYPEKFAPDSAGDGGPSSQYMPVYFSNVCLRFVPILDIVIHRFLEFQVQNIQKSFESVFDSLGCLYKFHDAPISFVYCTLHYYESNIGMNYSLKKKMVNSILCKPFATIREPNWCFSEEFLKYLQGDDSWIPGQEYLTRLIKRFISTIMNEQPCPFPPCDWRFNEFPNAVAHALHCTCVELLSLPLSTLAAGKYLLDMVLVRAGSISRAQVHSWINAVALLLTALPYPYWKMMFERVVQCVNSEALVDEDSPLVKTQDIVSWLNFTACFQVHQDHPTLYLLALCHAFWQHASIGQLSGLPGFLKNELKPLVKTEKQLIFVCQLIGPLLHRFNAERTRCLLDLTIELYEMVEKVDKNAAHLYHVDTITDFLYHIKYMFVGDGVKTEVEKLIETLRPALQMRLRYISFHVREDGGTAS